MKFSSLRVLEKHLAETPVRAPVYLLACPHDGDRREIAAKISPSGLQRFVGSAGFAAAWEELRTENLFAEARTIMIDEIDKLKEEDRAHLKRWIQRPSGKATLLLGIENARALSHFVSIDAHVLDLLQEKPWERQQRVLDDLRSMAREAKLAVDDEVLDFLYQNVSIDWTVLKREMEKLLAYGGQKKQIGLGEASALIATGALPEGWTLAEQLVFQPYSLATTPSLDASSLIALIGQLRYFLRLGRQLSLGDEKVKPYQVQKYGSKSREKGSRFFERGMLALNEVEALAKSSSICGDILLHRFAVRLHSI